MSIIFLFVLLNYSQVCLSNLYSLYREVQLDLTPDMEVLRLGDVKLKEKEIYNSIENTSISGVKLVWTTLYDVWSLRGPFD